MELEINAALGRVQTQTIGKIIQRAIDKAMADGWQPIETAPKDGTHIWLGDSGGVVTGYWSPVYGGWRCDWDMGRGDGKKPTHWRPLPAPPNAEGSK